MEQEPNEQEPNEATEIVGGKVETVEVSRHPEASIPETDLSLADIRAPSLPSVALGVDYSCRTVRHHRAILVRSLAGGE